MLNKAIYLVIKHRVTLMVILLVLTGFSIFQTAAKLSVDNSLSIWFLEDDPSYKAYIDFQEEYGSDEIFIAMFPVKNALGASEKTKLLALHKSIDRLSFVKTSFSLAKAKYPIYANGKINFKDLYNTERSEKGLKSILSKLPNITSQLVTKDFKHQFFYIQLKPTPSIEAKRQIILGAIESNIEKYYADYYLTGPPVLNEAYSIGIYKESLLFGVLTVLEITMMLLFLLPSIRYLLVSLLSVAVPLTLLLGIITSLGFALNMISMLIPTILMVYSVSDVVHVIVIYHKEGLKYQNISQFKLITLAIRKSLTPCFYTTLTTFVGYFALYLSPLPAFKNMGIFTCIGLVLSFFLVYVITIIGFSFMSSNFDPVKPVYSSKYFSQIQFINWLNQFTTRYKNTIIVGFTMVLLYGIFAVFQVKIDTNSLDLLAEGKAKQDLKYVESKLQSSSRLQLTISAVSGENMLAKEALRCLENFQDKLKENPLIAAPVSVVDIKSFLEKRSPVLVQPNISQKEIEYTFASVDNDDNVFFKLFSNDFKSAAITVSFKEMKTSMLDEMLSDIKQEFESAFDTKKYQLKINGFAVVFAQLNNFILETQFKSFFAAFLVGFICLWVFIRNFKTTILVLIPNVLPLVILAIFMSLFDIPLNVTTAMITPIMLGIAMDDTIHLVYKYKRVKGVSGTSEKRINRAMTYTGSALFSTTIALVGGFLIISLSATPSVREFGLLCAITVAIALITDIFYLPALLKKFDN